MTSLYSQQNRSSLDFRLFQYILLFVIILLATVLRVSLIDEWGIAHDRQFRGMLIARSMYLDSASETTEWQKKVAKASRERQESLEPPVTDYAISLAYRALGKESLRAARIVTVVFWFGGAILLFLLVSRLASFNAALISTTYYLFAPTAVWLSLAILPEPLMITLMIASLLSIQAYWESQSSLRLFLAITVTAIALLAKPLTVFVLMSAFLALAIWQLKSVRSIIRPHVLLFIVGSLIPAVMFYGYGLLIEDYLRWKLETSFLPHLLLTVEFWKRLLLTVVDTVGLAPLVLAVIAVSSIGASRVRPLLIGMGFGYIAFCIYFNYFTRFLVYYHSQLLVIIAIAIGPLLMKLAREWRPRRVLSFDWIIMFFAVLLMATVSYLDTKSARTDLRFEGEEIASRIGEIVSHSDRVAYISPVYGLPLEYYGELAGESWPRATKGWPLVVGPEIPRSIEDRISSLGFRPEYFVISNLERFENYHQDLASFLQEDGRLIAEDAKYLVYSLVERE